MSERLFCITSEAFSSISIFFKCWLNTPSEDATDSATMDTASCNAVPPVPAKDSLPNEANILSIDALMLCSISSGIDEMELTTLSIELI